MPYRKPPKAEISQNLPSLFTESPFLELVHPLSPAELIKREEKAGCVIYLWQRDQGDSRDLFSWVIPREWGDYSAISLGKLFRSSLLALTYVWFDQQTHPERLGRVIDLYGGRLYHFNHSSVLFTNRDVLRAIAGVANPSAYLCWEFDRVLKSLYALSYSVTKRVATGKQKDKWQGYIYGRVVNKLILGTRRNSKVRIVELTPEYQLHPDWLKKAPGESEDEHKQRLKQKPWTKTAIKDIQFDSQLSLEEMLFHDWYFYRGGPYKFTP